MKVLVTGATGFLGKYVVDFLKNDFKVVGLSRSFDKIEKNYRLFKTDYSVSHLNSLMEGCDAIIHLAAGRLNNTSSQNLQKNVSLDFDLFSVAHQKGIKNIVFISTRGVYGSQKAPWLELMPVQPENVYALAKSQSEVLVEFFNRKGLNIKILRLAQLLGVGEYKESAIHSFVENARSNTPIKITVEGIQREYIYVKDVLSALVKAINMPEKKGTYNLGSGELISLFDIAEKISAAFGRRELVELTVEKKIIEYSLMDSSLFREKFDWQPKYSIENAAIDMARILENSEVAASYGLSDKRK